jgi:hypothetical protein
VCDVVVIVMGCVLGRFGMTEVISAFLAGTSTVGVADDLKKPDS